MNGIDKITNEIINNSKEIANQNIISAQNEAYKIIADATSKADLLKDNLISEAQKKADDIITRGESSAALVKRKIMLQTKTEIINDTISMAYKALSAYEGNKYYDIILSIVKKYNTSKNGILFLSEKDLSDAPKNFNDEILKASNGKITLSDTPRELDSRGFILVFDKIEENYTFKAMFLSNEDKLKDIANELLFS